VADPAGVGVVGPASVTPKSAQFRLTAALKFRLASGTTGIVSPARDGSLSRRGASTFCRYNITSDEELRAVAERMGMSSGIPGLRRPKPAS